jgi:choline dehydrogenase-like flavoprotein
MLFGVGAAGAATFAGGLAWWRRERREPVLDYSSPEFQGKAARLAEISGAEPFDVCIVGSGPAGVVLGMQLARAGLRTLIIEAGANPSEMAKEKRFEQLNYATTSGDRPYPLTASRAMLPGGTSTLWTGNTPRLLPIDFERNAYTPPGTGWPIDYATVEPYYEKAEQLFHVTGESNVRYLPPRHRPLPNEVRGGNRMVKGLLARVDVVAFDTFRSRARTGGPIRVARDLLPDFVKFPTAVFLPAVTMRHLVADSRDHIAGVLVSDVSGKEKLIGARSFVLAAGAVESARRLLLSHSEHSPLGIGNAYDQVGRTFGDHLNYSFTASVATAGMRYSGALPQAVRSWQFYELFKRRGLGSLALVATLRETDTPDHLEFGLTAACEMEPVATNRVTLDESVRDLWGDPVAHLHFSVSERDRHTETAMHALVVSLYRRLGAKDITELPTHWGHHHLGTVRMGANPRTSVVDADHCVHGMRNLFVLTSGNFVTSGPANPTLLIVALAHRLAEHLSARMTAGAFAQARREAST